MVCLFYLGPLAYVPLPANWDTCIIRLLPRAAYH
jgi:hypothetical protein